MPETDTPQQCMTPVQYYRLPEAARITGLSIRSLQRYIKAGTLRATKLGKAKKSPVCIHRDWIEAFMQPVEGPDPAAVAADVSEIIGAGRG
jgi:excisionase family DNA binding protein